MLGLASVAGRLASLVVAPRLMRVCLICKRRDDMGPSVTGKAAVSHGLDHPGNETCVAEYKRRYCGGAA